MRNDGVFRRSEVYAYLLCEEVGSVEYLLKSQHCQQRNGEFGYHEYRSHRSELGIHGHIVEEKVGKPHEVAAPRQQYRQSRSKEQRPLHRTFHDEQTQYEQHQYKSAYVDRSACAGLVAPVLSQLLVNLIELRVGFLHSLFVHGKRH